MSNSKSNTGLYIGGGIAVTVVLLAIIWFFMGVSAHNTANKYEQTIVTAYENNKNVLSNVTAKLMQTAQVNKKYADDVKELATAALSARYGAEGSKATMQWIQERNNSLSPEIYTRLMDVIEAGRNEFQVNQSILLDKKRAYNTELNSYFTGMLMKGKGFPKIKLDDYKIVVSQGVIDTFESGVEKEVQLF